MRSFVRAKDGAPGEIRTPDPLVRSQVLYPTELRARVNQILASIPGQFAPKPAPGALGHFLVTRRLVDAGQDSQVLDSPGRAARFAAILDFFVARYSIQLSYGRALRRPRSSRSARIAGANASTSGRRLWQPIARDQVWAHTRAGRGRSSGPGPGPHPSPPARGRSPEPPALEALSRVGAPAPLISG